MKKFAMIGGGWRSEFYLRVAQEVPDSLEVCGVLMRDPQKSEALKKKWNVKTYSDLDSLLKTGPDFVVTSIPRTPNPEMIIRLVENKIPVLSETPPAVDLNGLLNLWQKVGKSGRVQVAEQYVFQPHHAARLAVARSGKLGTVSQAQVSVAHGYHGVSLIRNFLGIGFENTMVRARDFSSPLVLTASRQGPPQKEEIKDIPPQIIAQFDFEKKLGILDWCGNHYFSWIRSQRLLVRGERGEINNMNTLYLKDVHTPISMEIIRQNAGECGNLEGYFLKGYLAGADWVYQNPFLYHRLSDEEIAIGTCLKKMGEYTEGGPSFYSLAEASQDHYLSLLMEQSCKTQQAVTSVTQPWAQE